MRIASIPFDEELRLQDLYSYDILDSEKEKDFDELLEVAAQVYSCPMAAITFIDHERQWFKSKVGLSADLGETARNIAFCAHTLLENEALIVEDASKDERFYDNPLVTGELSIRFYAGVPIVSAGGYRLGTICVIDNTPRKLSRQQTQMLQILSRQISKLLELRLKNTLLRKKAEEQLQLEKILLHKTLQEYEEEKQSISTELHENIAQSLAATRFYLEMAEESGTESSHLIRKGRENIANLLQQVRQLSQAITPLLLTVVDLKDLLTGLLSQYHNKNGLEAKLIYEGETSVSSAIALRVYRIIEAQLRNVQSHASATSVTVNIQIVSSIFLCVKDNGVGFESKTFQRGVGLTKILSNAEALNGKVEITSRIKGGCELTVTIPRSC